MKVKGIAVKQLFKDHGWNVNACVDELCDSIEVDLDEFEIVRYPVTDLIGLNVARQRGDLYVWAWVSKALFRRPIHANIAGVEDCACYLIKKPKSEGDRLMDFFFRATDLPAAARAAIGTIESLRKQDFKPVGILTKRVGEYPPGTIFFGMWGAELRGYDPAQKGWSMKGRYESFRDPIMGDVRGMRGWPIVGPEAFYVVGLKEIDEGHILVRYRDGSEEIVKQ